MSEWSKNELGQYEYAGGKEDWEKVEQIASLCEKFVIDDEDEVVSDEERSCYNCRFRRWTKSAFVCMRR
ncbi:MAG: hypothetical protein PHR65_11605 [Syntrophomonadaceae bacterium]|nr:hypothetical protein [Syntrophomonadaceae bacterium]MDD3890546.1 hypothetical protein [Syntrophomonadaceae bacterium]